MKYTALGDSITYGAGASSSANSYIGRLNTDLGVTVDNAAVSTSMVMDQTPALYTRTTSTGDRSIVMLGTNDQAKYNTDPVKRGYFIDGLRAFSTWLSASCALVNPSSATLTGSWNNGYAFSCYGATSPGSKATFTVSGPTVVLGMLRQYNNSATFSVAIDGVNKGTFAVGGDVRTILGAAFGAMGLAFSGLGAGSHTVEVTVLSADSANVVFLHWFSACVPKAKAVIGNIPHAVAYTYGGSSANVDAYNADIASLASEMSGYGLDVSVVDICSALIAADMYDNVHPNDSGHLKIRGLFYTALTGQAPPVLVTPSTIYIGSDGNFYAGQLGNLKRISTVS
jgi:lysophospholipase L1-like esterase